MSVEEKLLPCPFCGEKVKFQSFLKRSIWCENCCYEVYELASDVNLFKKWNTRTPPIEQGNVNWPEKKEHYKPTSEQIGNGAYYDLKKIDGWNACHDAFMAVINSQGKELVTLINRVYEICKLIEDNPWGSTTGQILELKTICAKFGQPSQAPGKLKADKQAVITGLIEIIGKLNSKRISKGDNLIRIWADEWPVFADALCQSFARKSDVSKEGKDD